MIKTAEEEKRDMSPPERTTDNSRPGRFDEEALRLHRLYQGKL